MISPDIKDLMRNMDSRYTLVITAAKRARQLTGGAVPLTRFRSDKPVTLAIHEIAEGKVDYFRDVTDMKYYGDSDLRGREGVTGFMSVFYDDADGGDSPPYTNGTSSREYGSKMSAESGAPTDYDDIPPDADDAASIAGAVSAKAFIGDYDDIGGDSEIDIDDDIGIEDDVDLEEDIDINDGNGIGFKNNYDGAVDDEITEDSLGSIAQDDEWLPDE